MALQSKTQIYIAGKEVPTYINLMLHQQIDSHQTLELVCRMDVLENLTTELGEESKNFLGEKLSLQITSVEGMGDEYQEFEFIGIVTEVKTVKGITSSGDKVVIKVQSPTFLADDGPHYASYYDVSLSEIVHNSLGNFSKIELKNQPKDDATIHYSVQHNESAYDYVSRLAAQYSEWFYYNGKQIVFGAPEDEELELTYDHDLKEFHIALMPKAQNYKFYAKDYLLDEVHEKDAKDITSGANGYNGFVANKAKDIYTQETKIWHNLYIDKNAKQRLDKNIENQKKAIEIQQVKLAGISENPGVKLGNIVKVEGASYRVISVTHTNNENGDYENRFTAVTAEFDTYPNTNIQAYPRGESQNAIVKDNADPEGLGRIRVQFPWQEEKGEMTPWLRIVTPHAGGDKGFHFIPEVDEEVLIGFEGGNAEKPYMLGSLYHGTAKPDSWKTDANDIKAIRTRSGHTIEFNDAKGAESITITDINSNRIYIDTANDNIEVTANNNITISTAENMTFNAKNVAFNVQENMDLTIGKNKTEAITEKLEVTAKNSTQQIFKNKEVTIGKKLEQVSGELLMQTNEGKMLIDGKGKITIQSAEDVDYGD